MVRENVELAPLTYYKIGGPARFFAQPRGADELHQVAGFARERGLRYFVLGSGSNVLFDDRGFDGLVIQTGELDRTLQREQARLGDGATVRIATGASVPVIQLLRLCMADGIAGLERLVGVPGNLGGVLFMNAGTRDGEVAGVVESVAAFDLATGGERAIAGEQLAYGYRKSLFLRPHEVIVRGLLRGKSSDPKTVQQAVESRLDARRRSQPIDKPSCGSVFTNPDPAHGIHAWKLVDEAGLRGLRRGGAQVSELHANFIVNLGGATAEDVRWLISEAKRRVRESAGVELVEEVRVIPYNGGQSL